MLRVIGGIKPTLRRLYLFKWLEKKSRVICGVSGYKSPDCRLADTVGWALAHHLRAAQHMPWRKEENAVCYRWAKAHSTTAIYSNGLRKNPVSFVGEAAINRRIAAIQIS